VCLARREADRLPEQQQRAPRVHPLEGLLRQALQRTSFPSSLPLLRCRLAARAAARAAAPAAPAAAARLLLVVVVVASAAARRCVARLPLLLLRRRDLDARPLERHLDGRVVRLLRVALLPQRQRRLPVA